MKPSEEIECSLTVALIGRDLIQAVGISDKAIVTKIVLEVIRRLLAFAKKLEEK
jgi:hypothetical protein